MMNSKIHTKTPRGLHLHKQEIIKMRADGVSFGEIAQKLVTTRNAVISYHRRYIKKNLPVKSVSAKKQIPKPKVSIPLPEKHQCKFYYGSLHDGSLKLCQNEKINGSSYCKEHHKVCYRPVNHKDVDHKKRNSSFFISIKEELL